MTSKPRAKEDGKRDPGAAGNAATRKRLVGGHRGGNLSRPTKAHCLSMSGASAGTASVGLFAIRCLNPAYPAATIIAASVGRTEGEFSGH